MSIYWSPLKEKLSLVGFYIMTNKETITKKIVLFGCKSEEITENFNFTDRDHLKNLFGGKGTGLLEMSSMGLAIPPGFILNTGFCLEFLHTNKFHSEDKNDIVSYLKKLEQETKKTFGSKENFLLLSVRSGAKFSMPGMMDTILNIGLNDEIVEHHKDQVILDCYRRLLQMYGSVVLGVDSSMFEELIDEFKMRTKIKRQQDFTINHIKDLISEFKKIILSESGKEFPQDPWQQLFGAIEAVFSSWNSSRAALYRQLNKIPNDLGTAVNIQSMVFGNSDDQSGTGVLFSRNPSTGAREFFGEFLLNAQGEDVVAGIRTPIAIDANNNDSLKNRFPELFQELCDVANRLELHFKDMQDIEFTIEKGKLWILQSRSGKRSIAAAVKIALDLLAEGIINEKEALLSIDVEQIPGLLHDWLDPKIDYKIFAKGLPASPGAASGKIAFSAESAAIMAKSEKVILVRQETCPEDIHGMHIAEGVLTSRGGMTSHAAVVARGMGKACVCGVADLNINVKNATIQKGDIILREGDYITIDGSSGSVIIGEVPTVKSLFTEDLIKLLNLAKKYKKLGVRANAETIADVKTALNFGAEGVGLCRTEHMFFEQDKIFEIRKMILAENEQERVNAINKLKLMQEKDFTELLELMQGKPINIRLLDPPLHEFVPNKIDDIEILAKALGKDVLKLQKIIHDLEEENPMLGHRGCRLGVSYPALYNMQVQAIIKAAENVKLKNIDANIEIMIPFIIDKKELLLIKNNIATILNNCSLKEKVKIGTMIELPRACMIADQLASEVNFFSFGTNDLTQTSMGISRDDAGKFLAKYIENGIFSADPFTEIDIEGVGSLMKIAIDKARAVKPEISISVCGEHGGNKKSIEFFHSLGMNYVSCSPYRVPVAIITAAQKNIVYCV
jgi:pyruvate,orthophosphate dikinase